MYIIWLCVDHDLFHGKVKFGHMSLLVGNSIKNGFFKDIDLKVVRYRKLIELTVMVISRPWPIFIFTMKTSIARLSQKPLDYV